MAVTREQVVRDAFKKTSRRKEDSHLAYDFEWFQLGYNAARADLEATIAEQAEAIRVKDEAIDYAICNAGEIDRDNRCTMLEKALAFQLDQLAVQVINQ